MTSKPRILVVDDEPLIRGNLRTLLESEGYEVVEAENGLQAEQGLSGSPLSAVLMDLRMPGKDGLQLLREREEDWENLPVIVITAYGGSSAAIEAMKLGAFDYITKPFQLDEVLFVVRRALKQQSLAAQVRSLTAADERPGKLDDSELVGRSPEMLRVFKTIGRVAGSVEPVLILGESGTGKELVANAIHAHSERAQRSFVKVNCAAFNSSLLESEVFGHEKGAFTGAVSRRIGRFEQADGGTLFLDEIGELDQDLQAKLLRVLQTGRFERLGGMETVAVDVRIIAATNRNPLEMVAAQRFREDLLYRLNVVTIELPPLRQRTEDIPLLAEHLMRRLAQKYGWPNLRLAPEALELLRQRPWPGNVRQLQNVLAEASVLAHGQVILPDDLATADPTLDDEADQAEGLPLKEILARTERRVIHQALQRAGWNRTRASQLLGISRRQLFEKIRLYGLTR